ncbi:MAG: tRNA pseudouridine(55) synthase TruB [Planctomycetia bacterium]|nr:tRNA pseudouridine(55) synthase TruB [Planctomycetia bacterium]
MPLFGLLNLNKPAGMTSRDVVDVVQDLVRPDRTGHAGTLDPLASGVLVVCVGKATRLIEHVQRMPKRYTATFLLGRQSDTEDAEGNVTLLQNPPVPALEEIRVAADGMTGEIVQRPPAFSAVKVGGQRAYKLARRGQQPELAPRPVVVHHIEIVSYTYPELVLDVECGSGTYVRALGRDLAEKLGTAAVMSALVRTAIGDFRIEDAAEPQALTPDNLAQSLLPPRRAVSMLPAVALSAAQIVRLGHGLALSGVELPPGLPDGGEAAALDEQGGLAAIVKRDGECLRPVRCFL